MAKNNSLNNGAAQLTIDPEAATDSYTQYDINGVSKFRIGVDQDDGDKFKVSSGNALGTNDRIIIDPTLQTVTYPNSPLFVARNSASTGAVTGDGTVVTFANLTELVDRGNNFDPVTGIFTAPVDGIYDFIIGIFLLSIPSGRAVVCKLVLPTFSATIYEGSPQRAKNQLSFNGSVRIPLSAGDTATCTIQVSGGGKTVIIEGAATDFYSFISGRLVG